MELDEGGPLKRRIRNRDFRELAPGTWLPYQSEMEIYGHPATLPGSRVGTLTAKVESAEVDVPDRIFEADLPKGTLVRVNATGERYAFGMEKEALDKAILAAGGFSPAYRPVAWWRGRWATVALVVAAAGVVGLGVASARSYSLRGQS